LTTRAILTPVVLTLLSAVLYGLCFPPVSLAPLAWIALVPLLAAASRTRPGIAAACGVLWGVAAAYGVGWWFPGMLASFFGLPVLLGWAGFFAVSTLLAGVYFGAFGAWVSWLSRRGAASPLRIAAGWGACEFARATLLVANPWALLGYSQVSSTRLVQIADLAGPYGIGMLVAAVNTCLAGLLVPALRGRRPLAAWATVAAALVGALVYGEWRLGQTFGDGELVRVAIVQGAVTRAFRAQAGAAAAHVRRYVELTRQASGVRPELVVWPEYAVDVYLQEDSPERAAVLQVAHDLQTDLILGGAHYRDGSGSARYHNSVFVVRRGRLAGRYDKLRLLPFAEERPRWWPLVPRGETYEPGPGPSALATSRVRIGAFLCFESMYPELVRQLVGAGAEALANLSNDYWFGHAAPARHQLESASLRAIENRRYLLRATPTGFSAVIDPHGRALALSGFGVAEVLAGTIRASHAETPYQHWGDAACWLALAVVIGSADFGLTAWRRRR
jgi:apolipoprotein N-acyltransferase